MTTRRWSGLLAVSCAAVGLLAAGVVGCRCTVARPGGGSGASRAGVQTATATATEGGAGAPTSTAGGVAGRTTSEATALSASPTEDDAFGPGRQVAERSGPAHAGETIWALIVASERTRAAAEAQRQEAKDSLGEFETYFVVDESSHYAGMTPGWWVVFEPYREGSHARAQAADAKGWLASRGLDSYAKRVTVRCRDRFPLAEDLMEED